MSAMAEVPTHFPPQTYSSSFFLNAIPEDDKVSRFNVKRKTLPSQDSTPILDCLIKTFLFRNRDDVKDSSKCSNGEKAAEKELDVDLWKSKHHKATRSESPRSTFKKWRRNNSLKTQATIKEAKDKAGDEDMSLLKFLAINALDLSAPASDVLLKSRSSNWFQLSGHPDSLAPAGPGTVWKKRSGSQDDTERMVYEELSQDPFVNDIVPKYYREVEYQGEKFIELQDLLHGFQDPYVIDIKMGTRTFLECEVNKTTARNDLYQKMVAIDPSAPTSEEHELQAVTKLRYMQFREQQSSTCSHGFRIEAMKCRGCPPVTDLKKVKSTDQVINTLDMFINNREDVKQRLLKRLNDMRTKIDQSEYFRRHEVIGSSVFMIYDNNKVGVWLIDFAKTKLLPDEKTVNHRESWVQGNHEEGLLHGFDQLINIIEGMDTSQKLDGLDKKSLPAVTVKS
ncbi:PREDICTED: inositol-trisphosphate 3-kinase A isoform X2 [Nicrophorus vespilloides]|uniref:Kinase n=1 Tax=Nicrophorus vespilloides TaxID=110193 RepID=A0ABM1MZM0_NICVS|nr:PREDICTED: inositol-trisphosphate 3-kinase A isoform X2 [Nicrophorus vespilloides]